MACQYASNEPAFINKQQILNYEYSVDGKPSIPCLMLPIECSPRETTISELYVRTGAVPSGSDIRLYDLGTVYVSTYGGQQANVVIGELFVTYIVDLLKPKLVVAYGTTINYAHYYGTTAITTSNWFPSTSTSTTDTNLSMILSANTITFPSNIVEGNYIIAFYIKGSSGSSQPPGMSATTNCAVINMLAGDTNNITQEASETRNNLTFYFFVNITGPSAVCTLDSGAIPGTVTNYDIHVSQIAYPAN
jgi:hypothetical protein